MNKHLRAVSAAFLAAALALPAAEPSIKTDHTSSLKGKSTLAIAAFRVIFVMHDSISAESMNVRNQVGVFGSVSNTSQQDAVMMGVDKPEMQKVTDAIYADFLSKAKSNGYTVIEPKDLAAKAPEYKSLDMTESFEDGRWGTYVIPTRQVSASLAADDSKAIERGSKAGAFRGFKANSQKFKKGEADKVFVQTSSALGDVPLIAVTYVVSFAKFKGTGTRHFLNSAKTSIEWGATINGFEEQNPMATGIQVWDKSVRSGAMTAGSTLALKGDLHDETSLGKVEKFDAKTKYEGFSNTLTYLNGSGNTTVHKGYVLNADKTVYINTTTSVASKANDMLIAALVKERS